MKFLNEIKLYVQRDKDKKIRLVQIYFPYEECGTMYFRKEGEDIVISSKIITECARELKLVSSGQNHFNVKGIFDTNKLYYHVYLDNGEYRYRPIKAEELLSKGTSREPVPKNKVRYRNNLIHLHKDLFNRLTNNKKMGYYKIRMNLGTTAHIEIEGCESKTKEETGVDSNGSFNCRYAKEDYEYKVKAQAQLYVSRSFVERTGLQNEDLLNCTWVGNKLIIDSVPVICDICHKPIIRRIENAKLIYRCEECTSALDKFGGLGRASREELVKKLCEYSKSLDSMIDKFIDKKEIA